MDERKRNVDVKGGHVLDTHNWPIPLISVRFVLPFLQKAVIMF